MVENNIEYAKLSGIKIPEDLLTGVDEARAKR